MSEYKYPSKEYLEEQYLKLGKSIKQIAEENGVKPSTVKTHLYEKRIKKNDNRISKETLIEMYQNTNKSIMQVARELGTNDRLVSKYLDKYGIEKQNNRYALTQYDPTNDAEWVRLYTEERMSANQIAIKYGTTHRVVIYHLRRCGIETRDFQMAQLYAQNHFNVNPDLFNYDIMYDLHINQRLGAGVIADKYKCDIKIVLTCLRNLGIPIYNTNNVIPDPTLKHNYESSLSQRIRSHTNRVINPKVLERDGYRCRMCGRTDSLEVHHNMFHLDTIIDCVIQSYPQYNVVDNIDELFDIVTNSMLYNDISGIITVCSMCHHEIHRNDPVPISSEEWIVV